MQEVNASSCVVSLHACNEANRDVVVGAMVKGALWAVMPCCIRQKQYLPECSIEIDDETRYLLLTGAFANEYSAQMIRPIDRLITGRNVLIAGGLDRPTSPDVSNETQQSAHATRAPRSGQRMPALEIK
jgi:hypothetical protein